MTSGDGTAPADDWAARLARALHEAGVAAGAGAPAAPGSGRADPSPPLDPDGPSPDAGEPPGVPAVAAIGARAARLLDAVRDRSPRSPPGGPSADVPPADALPSSGSSPAGDPPADGSPADVPAADVDGPRFATLADCAAAAPGERTARSALLTFDALGDAPASPKALDRALGTACRLYPARLLLFVDALDAPPPETLFAFGFRRLLVGPDAVLHEYRLRDYKMPPDWLNARFWANPARFGLDPDEDAVPDPADDAEDDEDEDEEDDGEE